jgi:hypothetical protein
MTRAPRSTNLKWSYWLIAALPFAACSGNEEGRDYKPVLPPPQSATGGSGAEPAAVASGGAQSAATTQVGLTPLTSTVGGTTTTANGTGGTQGIGDTVVIENCASTAVTATDTTTVKPADIIFAIDGSTSMDLEIEFVQTYMNGFSQQIIDSGIDVRVILLGSSTGEMQGGMGNRNGICIGAPLGSGVCPEDSNPPTYVHIAEPVGSNDALNVIIDSFADWQPHLRPNAAKFFVVVTDDDATDEPNDSAATFAANLTALDPVLLAEWSMNGVYCFTDCEEAAAVGQVYVDLVAQTGGIGGDLCLQDFQPVFDRLAEQIIENAGAEIACEWEFPAVPEGQTFSADLIEVRRTSTMGTTTIPRVMSAEDCASQGGGWYYDDVGAPTQILACPTTCQEMQDDAAGMIDVVFGCEMVEGCAASSLTAENTVMGADLVCEWPLPTPPSGTTLDSETVNVRFTNTAGVATELGKVPSPAECSMFARGWCYDNEEEPTKVLVCPDVCSQIQEGGVNTKIDILLGCKTKPAEIE